MIDFKLGSYRLVVVLAVLLLVSCGTPAKKRSHFAAARTKVSEEIQTERVRIIDSAKVLLDGRVLGFIRDGQHTKFAGPLPPETLPDGIHAYEITDLKNGWLLLTGGYEPEKPDALPITTRKTYFWKLSSKQLERGPDLTGARAVHQITRLPDGRLLVTGGISPTGEYVRLVEMIDPNLRSIRAVGNLLVGRLCPAILCLDNSTVLIAGGQIDLRSKGTETETPTIELYDIKNCTSRLLGNLCYNRQCASLLRVTPHAVLVVGGFNSNSEANSNSLPPEVITVP